MFHYLAWPDHGVPANAMSMINFIKRVRKAHPYSKVDLVLVHCSAGVGRTGTFITLDYMLERIKNENNINIFEFVNDLRRQRVWMVQTMVGHLSVLYCLSVVNYYYESDMWGMLLVVTLPPELPCALGRR